jgi:hypothetical protein
MRWNNLKSITLLRHFASIAETFDACDFSDDKALIKISSTHASNSLHFVSTLKADACHIYCS